MDDTAGYVTVEDNPEAFGEAVEDGHVYDTPVAEIGEYAHYRGAYYRVMTEQTGTVTMERQVVVGERTEDTEQLR